jgi:hypothetical protein
MAVARSVARENSMERVVSPEEREEKEEKG